MTAARRAFETAAFGRARGAARPLAGVVVAALLCAGGASAARAQGDAGRWSVGFRVGNFFPADAQDGGFRVTSQVFGARTESSVKIDEVPLASFMLGYDVKKWTKGAKKWQNVKLSLELDVSRVDASLGKETAFVDPDASTRVRLCFHDPPMVILPGNTGDENYQTLKVGDVTLTPVLVNALFHWGSSRADFYSGPGLGIVLTDATEADEYRNFVGDFDGVQDLGFDDALAFDLKVGSNVRLDREGRWQLFFEAQFITTQFLSSQPQFSWPGVNGTFGQRACDRNGDNIPDEVDPADFRLVDPGRVRADGASAGVGLRFRFGKGPKAPAEPATPAEAPPTEAPTS